MKLVCLVITAAVLGLQVGCTGGGRHGSGTQGGQGQHHPGPNDGPGPGGGSDPDHGKVGGSQSLTATGRGPLREIKFQQVDAEKLTDVIYKLRRQRKDYSVVMFDGATYSTSASIADFGVSAGAAYTSGRYATPAQNPLWGWPVIITNHVRLGVVGTAVLVETVVGGDVNLERVWLLDKSGSQHKCTIAVGNSKKGERHAGQGPGHFDVVKEADGNLRVTFVPWATPDTPEQLNVIELVKRAATLGATSPAGWP